MPEIEKPFRKTGDAAISESPLHPRRKSHRIMVGPVPVGGGAPISVQSMTNTLTADVPATLQQIAELTAAGCDIVRVAVPSQDDADALPEYGRKYSNPNSNAARIKRGVCELCGQSAKDIRMYHVRKMKDLTDNTEWDRLMKKMRRKSLAVCKSCFDKIHNQTT